MYGPNDPTHQQPTIPRPAGRHRPRGALPAPLALGLTVAVLLSAFGAGAAMLPASVTGSGVAADLAPAAAAAPPAATDGMTDLDAGPGPTDGATPAQEPSGDPAAEPPGATPATAAPKPKPEAEPKPKPSAKSGKPAGRPAGKPAGKPKAPTAPDGRQAKEDEVTRLVNIERAKAGCGSVKTNEKLRTAMRRHVQDMADQHYFSHDSKDGRSPWDRSRAAGYQHPIGENIAKGQRTAADVMKGWMNSPGHRANILNCAAKAIGVGLAYEGNTPIWGQLFGSK